jgi:hypothetical protein
MLAKVANKDTQPVVSALIKQAKKLPSELYTSLTWDRGKELTDHRRGRVVLGSVMQFSRVILPVEDIQIWNASSDGFSFVISCASRSGSGLQGNPGFVASWRPLYQNRFALKIIGSPFKTLDAAEQACEVMLANLISDNPSSRRAVWTN